MLTAYFGVTWLLDIGNPKAVEKALDDIPVHSETANSTGTTDFPTSPQDVYRNVIDKLWKRKNKNDEPLRVLSWILYAARPLKMEELLDALAVAEDEKVILERHKTAPEEVVKSCQPLVDYDPITRVVRFTHDTVREYLERYCKNQLYPPSDLAKTCLHYVGLDEFNEPCLDPKALQSRLDTYRFTEYACEYWGYHARGRPKDEMDIEEVTIRTFETANKLQAVAQINRYASFGRFDIPQKTITFHSLALNGLVTLCEVTWQKKLQGGGE